MDIYTYYHETVMTDAEYYIDNEHIDTRVDGFDEDAAFDEIFDDMWASDWVCGNGSENGHDDVLVVVSAEEIMSGLLDKDLTDNIRDAYGDDYFGRAIVENVIGQGTKGVRYLDTLFRTTTLEDIIDDVKDYFLKSIHKEN